MRRGVGQRRAFVDVGLINLCAGSQQRFQLRCVTAHRSLDELHLEILGVQR